MIWNNSFADNLSYLEFQIGDTKVLVGPRPDRVSFTKKTADLVKGWLSVTDYFVDYPSEYNARWFPFAQDKALSVESAFGIVKTLHNWIDVQKLPLIYIHCDQGQMRSPTALGAYLHAFRRKESEQIFKNVKLHQRSLDSELAFLIEIQLMRNPKLKVILDRVSEFPNASLDDLLP